MFCEGNGLYFAVATLVASGTFCLGNAQAGRFTVPQAGDPRLQPDTDYTLCAVPQAVVNFTCGTPTCVHFSTYDQEVPLECEMSQCDCADAAGGCKCAPFLPPHTLLTAGFL